MDDNSQDVFARALLYMYRVKLESLGLEGDLRVVRVGEAKKDDPGEKKCPEAS